MVCVRMQAKIQRSDAASTMKRSVHGLETHIPKDVRIDSATMKYNNINSGVDFILVAIKTLGV